MAIFGCFNKELVVVFVLSIVMTHVTPVQCIDLNGMMTDKLFPKARVLFCGWTGLSVGAFIGKKAYHHWANTHPAERARYMKMAHRCRVTSRIGAVPLVSMMCEIASEAVCAPLANRCSSDSIFREPLDHAPRILGMPGVAMTFVPAYFHTVHTNPNRLKDDRIEENRA